MSFLEKGWASSLEKFIQLPESAPIYSICKELEKSHEIYPPNPFRALELLRPEQVNVIILGQEPYHNPLEANGLAFSVSKKSKLPRTLTNIFAEIEREFGHWEPPHGDLTHWSTQGVLLLNCALTVKKKTPNSHLGLGWEFFVSLIIDQVLEVNPNVIVLAWGKKAQQLIAFKNIKHLLTAAHPSPAAIRGFYGCGHFKKCNAILKKLGKKEIDWRSLS